MTNAKLITWLLVAEPGKFALSLKYYSVNFSGLGIRSRLTSSLYIDALFKLKKMIIPATNVTPINNKDASLKNFLFVRCIAKTFRNYSVTLMLLHYGQARFLENIKMYLRSNYSSTS